MATSEIKPTRKKVITNYGTVSRTVKSQCKNAFNYLDIYQLVECNHHLRSFSPVLRQTRLPTGELSKIDVNVGDQVDR